MKKFFRMLVFSSLALVVTSLWNNGFIISGGYLDLAKLIVLMAAIHYLLIPLSRIVLFPINLFTFGLASFLIFLLSFHLLSTYFHLIIIKNWQFYGLSLLFVQIPKMEINYVANLILCSLSVSSIINLLETIL